MQSPESTCSTEKKATWLTALSLREKVGQGPCMLNGKRHIQHPKSSTETSDCLTPMPSDVFCFHLDLKASFSWAFEDSWWF